MNTVWIEAALNGPWARARRPGIPDDVPAIIAEGIACAQAGACIIHTHAYEGGGEQTFDWTVYARIIEGIRAKIDVPVYPSIASAGIAGPGRDVAAERFAHIEELAKRGLLEFAVVDPGSVNFTSRDVRGEDAPAPTYLNPEAHVRHGLDLARRFDFRPAYAIYEPGFLRAGAVLAKALGAKTPVYRLMFSDAFAFGFPPVKSALDAYLDLLAAEAPGAPWMIAGLKVDLRGLIPEAVRRGGHIRVGLEDAPFDCPLSNVKLVEDAVRRVREAGGAPATTKELRAAMG